MYCFKNHIYTNTRDSSLIKNIFVCFPGKLWRSLHTHHVGSAQASDFTRVQTSGARPAVGKHQHSGRADVLHTEFTLRRPGPGRLFFRRERFGAVAVRRQSTERSRQVTMPVHFNTSSSQKYFLFFFLPVLPQNHLEQNTPVALCIYIYIYICMAVTMGINKNNRIQHYVEYQIKISEKFNLRNSVFLGMTTGFTQSLLFSPLRLSTKSSLCFFFFL